MKAPNGAATNLMFLNIRKPFDARTKGDALVYTKRYGDVEYTVVKVVGSHRNNPRDTRQKTFYVTDIIKNASGRSLHPASADSKVFTRTGILNPTARYVKENFADEAKQGLAAGRAVLQPISDSEISPIKNRKARNAAEPTGSAMGEVLGVSLHPKAEFVNMDDGENGGFPATAGQKKGADVRMRAMNLARDYAVEHSGGLTQLGAAPQRVIARLVREYKRNIETFA